MRARSREVVGRPSMAGAALLAAGVFAAAGALLVTVREPPVPSVRVALPPRPEPPAPAPTEHPREVAAPVVVRDDPVADDPQAAAVVPPGFVVLADGLAWDDALATAASVALPPSVGFLLPLDHPEVQARLDGWQAVGRDVVLEGGGDDPAAILAAHPNAAGVLRAGALVPAAPGTGPRDVAAWIDAALLDPPGFEAALQAASAQGVAGPPAVIVVAVYPGVLPALAAWLDAWLAEGHRLARPGDLAGVVR